MNNNEKTKNLTGMAIFSAIVIVLQFLSNYIQLGTVSITLSLIPIVIGSILFGPLAGAFLGFINGIVVLLSPSTIAVFFSLHPIATILICLSKTTIAGLISGLIYKYLKLNEKSKVILCSISVPVINTSIFAILCLIFFKDLLYSGITDKMTNIYSVLLLGFIGINFLLELSINFLLSNVAYTLIKYKNRKHIH